MLGKILAVGIIGFWLVMMTLLIRSELLQSKPLTYSVPIDTVMQKMFEGGETSDLSISYQGKRIGRCSLQVTKNAAAKPAIYLVKSELMLDFSIMGKAVRLQSWTDSEFDDAYQMTKFRSHTRTGDSKIEVSGDLESKEVELLVNVGNDYQEKHKLPFSSIEQMGPSGAMGLFGMGGLQTSQGALENTGLASLQKGKGGPVTTVQEAPLEIGKDKLSTLMVHTRYDDSVWSKVYVNPLGEIIKVETSFGVTMLSAQFSGQN